MRSLVWQMVFGKWQIYLANFTIHIGYISSAQNVGEIERQIFCRMLCVCDFLLGAQRLVKLTPAVNFINVLCARFLYKILAPKNSSPKHSFVILGAKILYEKCIRKTLMKLKLTPDLRSKTVAFSNKY